MRVAVLATLEALYKKQKVTANKSIECKTTRITNEICTLRNDLGIDIAMDRIYTINHKWYGSYRLIQTEENLEKTRTILKHRSKQDEV